MKKIIYLCLLTVVLGSCTEIAPVVPALGDRKVLVEEFTGVRCVNCPAGASELENLKGIYGERLVIVSIHAGDFSPPFTDSRFDFRTAEGDAKTLHELVSQDKSRLEKIGVAATVDGRTVKFKKEGLEVLVVAFGIDDTGRNRIYSPILEFLKLSPAYVDVAMLRWQAFGPRASPFSLTSFFSSSHAACPSSGVQQFGPAHRKTCRT